MLVTLFFSFAVTLVGRARDLVLTPNFRTPPGARSTPVGNPTVSTLALLVVLLLVLVVLLIVSTVVFLVHRRPSLNGPVTAGVATVAALAAVLAVIFSAGGGR
ncbi:hypothetical protein OK006_10559 [Actinobacteria bacterium OK006]|nr:hypothetical protein OK006_10559 [Actinobacteria bacterium OK006]